MKQLLNRIGLKFNLLTVTSLPYKGQSGRYYIDCLCDCGKSTSITEDHLIDGHTRSCGHLLITNTNRIHGFSKSKNKVKRKFYLAWVSMKQRCYNVAFHAYADYGGRGITVCDRWLESFENFKDDMYKLYLKHGKIYGFDRNTSLDRYPNVNGNYEPGNVRWSTRKEQSYHTRSVSNTKNINLHRKFINSFLSLLAKALRDDIKISKSKYLKYLGCTIFEFKNYFQLLFLPGMTWDNHGNGKGKWNFGHIIGCNNFDLSKEEDRKICFNFKNFTPEWSIVNGKKLKRKLRVDNILRKQVAI